jgi:hypothetical protein
MHDYDVGITGLSVPPPSAVIQSYRPAVLVKNNGVHDALAVGSLRIYSPAGLLIFTSAIYSGVIAPGETSPAQADEYWTPPALGRCTFIAFATCINDQYSPNNNLPPTFVDVIPGEPTPPTPVALHAAQHEEGGGDELNIDGLHGRATDAQTPIGHKASHQVSGSDVLDLTGMSGVLATPQPIADHHATHEDGGGDELVVDDLHGVLYNLQKPQVHANEAHDPNFAITPHGNEAHDPNYANLDIGGKVPSALLGGSPANEGLFLRADQSWSLPTSAMAIATIIEGKGHPLSNFEALHGFIPAGMTKGATIHAKLYGFSLDQAPSTLTLRIFARDKDDPSYTELSDPCIISNPGNGSLWYSLDATLYLVKAGAPLRLYPTGILHGIITADYVAGTVHAPIIILTPWTPNPTLQTEISIQLTSPDSNGTLLGGILTLEHIGDIT